MKKWSLISIGFVLAVTLSGTLGYTFSRGGQTTADWSWCSPTIVAEVGDSFLMSLESNPTTGYVWQAQFDDERLELVETKFEATSEAIGAGGFEIFEFRALKEGDTDITMVYERSLEEAYIEQVILSINITES